MTVHTEDGTWVVPARRAVWIPAKTPHSIVMSGPVSIRTIYLRARIVQHLPRTCCVVNVASLLKELILHACRYPTLNRRSKIQAHLIDVIIDQLENLQAIPLQLPSPSDRRVLRVAAILEGDPGESLSLEKLCEQVGASKRTIERIFRQETSLSLGKWRQQLQLRLIRSLQLLAAEEKITTTALEAGYGTPSAFIAMLRKALGLPRANTFKPNSTPNSDHHRL